MDDGRPIMTFGTGFCDGVQEAFWPKMWLGVASSTPRPLPRYAMTKVLLKERESRTSRWP